MDSAILPISHRPYVLFDFDGTLADTAPAIKEAAASVLLEDAGVLVIVESVPDLARVLLG